jgi:hypothetical protein
MKHRQAENQDDLFQTFDLGLASSLTSLGYELVGLNKSNPKKAQFIFKRDGNTEKTVSDYWNGNLELNARVLFDNQKMLKNRLYSD